MKNHNKGFFMILFLVVFIFFFSFNGVVSAASDLVPMSVSSTNYNPKQGDSITVTWKVKNVGTSSSGSFSNRVSLAYSEWGTDIKLAYFSMNSISAGSYSSDSQSVQIPTTATVGTCYYLTVWADAYQSINEGGYSSPEENNNIEKAPSQVCIASSGPAPSTPSAPTPTSPASSSTLSTLTPTLDWNDVSANPSVDYYQIQIWQGSNRILYDNPTASQYTVPSGVLSSGTNYYWYVFAHNSLGFSSASNIWYFTTPSQQSCTNECSYSGEITCDGNYYKKTCGQYDGDSCLDWSSSSYCTYGCSGGNCNQQPNIECYSNSGCETDGFVAGTEQCLNDNVYARYRTNICMYAGTTSSYCTYSENLQEKEPCSYGCENNRCVTEEEACRPGWFIHRACASSVPSSPPKFLTLPFKDKEVRITDAWADLRRNDDGTTRFHKGIDYATTSTNKNFEVLAAALGNVTKVLNKNCPTDGAGCYVRINHTNYMTLDGKEYYYTSYYHLKEGSVEVSENQIVQQGQKIGLAGDTGDSTGIHLHFDVREGPTNDGRVDPYDLEKTGNLYGCTSVGSNAGSNYLWTKMPPRFADEYKSKDFNLNDEIVINIDGWNFRNNPGTACNEAITQLSKETKGIVIDGPVASNGYDWWKIKLEDNREGWVAQSNSEIKSIIIDSTADTINPGERTLIEVMIDIGSDVWDAIIKGANYVGNAIIKGANYVVTFFVGLLNNSDISMRLFSPTGAVIDENTAATDPNVELVSAPGERTYTITNPEPGKWIAEITGTDIPHEDYPYIFEVSTFSTLIAEVSTNKEEYSQNEPIKIFASVSDAGTVLKGVNIKAEMKKPDGLIMPLPLFDNGRNEDADANDGLYANSFNNYPFMAGEYNIKIIVNGSTETRGEFTREASKTIKVIDTTPPIITINSPEEKDYSYTGSFEIEFSVNDDSGIELSSALLDNAEVNNNDIIELSDFNLGEHEFKIYAKDKIGNEDEKIIAFNVIDDIAPETTHDYDGAWKNQNFYITLISIDEKSSVREIHYILNNGLEQTTNGNTAHVLIEYEDDNNTIEYWAIDEWDNKEEHKILNGIKLDKTSPQSNDDFVDEWKLQDFYINLNAQDIIVQGAPSGLNEIYYELFFDEQSQGIKKVSTDGIPLINYEDDNSKLEYWSADIAGNEEQHNFIDSIKLDKTSPELRIDYPNADATYLSSEIKDIEFYAEDQQVQGTPSGIDELKWFVDGEETDSPNEMIKSLVCGEHSLTLKATDKAGNTNEVSLNFTIIYDMPIDITPKALKVNPGVIMAHLLWTEFVKTNTEIISATLDKAREDKILDDEIRFRRMDIEEALAPEKIDTHFELEGIMKFKESECEFRGKGDIDKIIE